MIHEGSIVYCVPTSYLPIQSFKVSKRRIRQTSGIDLSIEPEFNIYPQHRGRKALFNYSSFFLNSKFSGLTASLLGVMKYSKRAIITRGLYTFYPLFEVHLCIVTFGLMYGQYSRAVSNQERVIVARVRYMVVTQ